MPDRLKTLDRAEVLARLGTQPGEALTARIDEAIAETCALVRPNAIYRYLNLEEAAGGVRLKGTDLILPGQTAAGRLEHCQSCALLAVTVGAEAEQAVRDAPPEYAPLLRACAAAAAAFLQRQLERQVRGEALRQRMYATTSLCPGQGDFPREYVRQIAEILDVRSRMGIRVEEDLSLTPAYSWLAVAGLSGRGGVPAQGCKDCCLNGCCGFLADGAVCAVDESA